MKKDLREETKKGPRKKFIGVHFECCSVYKHVYYNEKENAYIGYCPFCHRKVRVLVDPQRGINARFFRAR